MAGKPFDLPSLQALVDRKGHVRPLEVYSGGHPVTAYYLRHPNSRGVLILFGGSGNQVDAPLKTFDSRTAALGLDLVVFYYYQEGEPVPSVAEAQAKARAVYAAVKALPISAARTIYLLGHSLGGWFALDVAANENARGLVLVGAGTTSTDIIRKTYSPWANLVMIRPDEDHKRLDASLYASRLHASTLVGTSRQDEAVPVAVSRKLFGMVPAAVPKRLVVFDGVSHERYFLSDEFWRQFADFFGLHTAPATGHA